MTDDTVALPDPDAWLEDAHGTRPVYLKATLHAYGQECAREAVRLYIAGRVGAGWRPIETAPKDGRTVLLGYFNACGKWRTLRGQWYSEAAIADEWEYPDEEEAGWYETSVEAEDTPNVWATTPAHWMPLPAAPTTPPDAQESKE